MAISLVSSVSMTGAPAIGARMAARTPPTAPPEAVKFAVKEEAKSPTPSAEQVSQAVKQVNESFTQKGQNLYAAIEKDKATGINVVKVLDKNTQEVISQFPSKEIVAMAQAMSQSLQGNGGLISAMA
ncbi:MAG: flagellar protein FlaG [Gallionellaceae bacterium]|jgi:flagellar protein FlaG